MALITNLTGVSLIAAVAGLCYLLNSRLSPFQPGSFMSGELGLDLAYPTPTVTAAAVTPIASTTSPSAGAASSVTTGVNGSTAVAPLYSIVNGADMPGNDIPPDASNPSVFSQPTYAATGCQAICSSNNKCKAAVYQPSTQACYMKSAVVPTAVSSNADRVLMPQGNPETGQVHANGSYSGTPVVNVHLPSSGDCSSLCAALPYSTCSATTYGLDGTCHVLSNAGVMSIVQGVTSWAKNWTATG